MLAPCIMQEMNSCFGGTFHSKRTSSVIESARRRLEERRNRHFTWKDSLKIVERVVNTGHMPIQKLSASRAR